MAFSPSSSHLLHPSSLCVFFISQKISLVCLNGRYGPDKFNKNDIFWNLVNWWILTKKNTFRQCIFLIVLLWYYEYHCLEWVLISLLRSYLNYFFSKQYVSPWLKNALYNSDNSKFKTQVLFFKKHFYLQIFFL